MKTKIVNVTLNQGADFDVVMLFSDQNGPKDMTGYEFLGQIRENTAPSEDTPIAEFTLTVLDQTTNKGQVRWMLPLADVEDVVASVATPLVDARLVTPFVYDVKMKATDDKVTRILQGLVKLSPQATQEDFS